MTYILFKLYQSQHININVQSPCRQPLGIWVATGRADEGPPILQNR